MSDLAPDSRLAPPADADAPEANGGETSVVAQWLAVEDAAKVLAILAGHAAPVEDAQAAARIRLLAQAAPSRVDAATFALCEMVATMRAGLDALLAAHGSAADARTAATRLWNEYERERAKVLAEVASALGF